MQEQPRLSELQHELTHDHYLPSPSNPTGDYSWDGLDMERLTRRFNCHAKHVREAMRKIEAWHPKPEKEVTSNQFPVTS